MLTASSARVWSSAFSTGAPRADGVVPFRIHSSKVYLEGNHAAIAQHRTGKRYRRLGRGGDEGGYPWRVYCGRAYRGGVSRSGGGGCCWGSWLRVRDHAWFALIPSSSYPPG